MWFTEGVGSFLSWKVEKICVDAHSFTSRVYSLTELSLKCRTHSHVSLSYMRRWGFLHTEIQLQKISVTCESQLDTCGGGGDLTAYRNIPHMQSSLTCGSQLHAELRMLSHAEIPLMYRFHLCVGLSYVWISVMWGDRVPSHIGLNMTKRATKVKFLTP